MLEAARAEGPLHAQSYTPENIDGRRISGASRSYWWDRPPRGLEAAPANYIVHWAKVLADKKSLARM